MSFNENTRDKPAIFNNKEKLQMTLFMKRKDVQKTKQDYKRLKKKLQINQIWNKMIKNLIII